MGMDESVRRRAIREITLILETAGYDIEEEGDPFDLSAVAGKECILVMCTDDPTQARIFDNKPYILEEDGEKIPCKKLIFTRNERLNTHEASIWLPDDLGRYAGEAAVARVEGRRYRIQPGEPPVHKQQKREGLMQERQIGHQSSSPGSIACLPVHVGQQEAARISGQKGEARLRLIPHWAYQYSCMGQATFKGKQICFDGEGTGAISAINGLRQEIDPEKAISVEIPDNAEVVKPSIPAKDAETQILQALTAALSQRIRIKTESGDAIFSEEKTFKPNREQINLKVWLVHVPVWQVRGRNIVEVNATTGEILAEPMDEGVELL